jgi:hypothetical protein
LVRRAAPFRGAFVAYAEGTNPAQIFRERRAYLELGSEVLDGWADCPRVRDEQ